MQWKRVLIPCFCLFFFLMVAIACSDESGQKTRSVNMVPGLWEIKSVVEMKNMPVAMPPATVTQCLTADDLVPQSNYSGPGACEISNLKISGDTVSYDLKCSSGGSETLAKGTITYSGATMEGTIQMEVSGQASMQMTTKLSGKRIGDCK